MHFSSISTRLIAVCVISRLAGSLGELTLIRGAPKQNRGSYERKLVCTSEDDGAALVWNFDIESSLQPQSMQQIPYTECAIIAPDKCIATWELWSNGTKNAWELVSSLDYPMGPVLDFRWEDFDVHGIGFRNSDKYVKWQVQDSETRVFSARGLGDMKVLLCERGKPQNEFCSGLNIVPWPSNTSVIRSYSNVVSESLEPSENRQGTGSYRQKLNCVQYAPKVVNSSRIELFRYCPLMVLNIETTVTVALLERTGCYRITPLSEYEWQSFVVQTPSYPFSLKEFDLHVGSSEPGLIRMHAYEYILSTETNTNLSTYPFYHSESFLCIDLLVSLCSECELSISVVDTTGNNIQTLGSILGNSETTPNQLPTWRIEKRNVTLPPGFPSQIKLKFSTRLDQESVQGRWAIDYIRKCPSLDGTRELKTNVTRMQLWDQEYTVACQKLSYTENLVVRTDAEHPHDIPKHLQECLEHGPTSPFCRTQQKYSHKGTSICASSGCICAPGFTGDDCEQECPDGSFGYDCLGRCDQCELENCNKSTGNCQQDSDVASCTVLEKSHNESVPSTSLPIPYTTPIPMTCKTGEFSNYYAKPTKLYCEQSKEPSPPWNLIATNQGRGVVTLEWSSPLCPCGSITHFEISSGPIWTNLQIFSSESFSIAKQYSATPGQQRYSSNLDLPTSTSYNISIRAINMHESSAPADTSVYVPPSVGFINEEIPEISSREGTSMTLKIPTIDNATATSHIEIVVKGSPPCDAHTPMPPALKKFINMTDYETGWIARKFNVRGKDPQSVTIGDKSTDEYNNENCPLRPGETYAVVVVLEVDKHEVLAIVIPSTTKPSSPTEASSPNVGSQSSTSEATFRIIFLFILAICFFIALYIWRRKFLKILKRPRQRDGTLFSQTFVNYVKSEPPCVSQDPPLSPNLTSAEPLEIITIPEVVESDRYSHSVTIKDFENYVKDAIANGLLKSQFKMLTRGLNRPHENGSLPENKIKNRYTNVLPYDCSRVILEKTLNDFRSDYINANYVPGFRKMKGYIASQGPKPETVVDFWRMIWQEKSLIICMLANLRENYKVKCEQYWPEFGSSESYGDILVMTERHQAFADYIIRTFLVRHNNESRKITHLHYTGWPDHQVPVYSNSVIAYLKKLLTLTIGTGPIIVHCSAGIGRTGTIILCDICLRVAVSIGAVDVLAEFKKLRDCRMNMVDNELQYIFAHIILTECLVSLPTDLPCDNELPRAIEKLKKRVPQHMKRLRDMVWKDQALQSHVLSGPVLPQQLVKNRFPELAPDSSSLVYLQRYPIDDNNSDYISTVIVDGLKAKKQYIASQLPLPSTLSDFWRLIAEQRIELVIMLQRPDLNNLTCCNIIPGGNPINPVSYITVETKTRSEFGETPIVDELLLTDTSAMRPRTQRVTVLTCNEWAVGRGGKPPAPGELVKLWIASENVHREKGATLVICHDGVTGCGLYLALSFLLERMSVERECDIIFAVRAIRRSRKDFVQSQEQFEYLYDAAAEYVECFEDYANFA